MSSKYYLGKGMAKKVTKSEVISSALLEQECGQATELQLLWIWEYSGSKSRSHGRCLWDTTPLSPEKSPVPYQFTPGKETEV